jgi:hypothetical protein
MTLSTILEALKIYGAPGLLLIMFVYIIVKGQISFEYPRRRKSDDS